MGDLLSLTLVVKPYTNIYAQ